MYLSIYLYYYVQWIVSSARATVVAVLCRAASTITTTTNYSVLVGLRFNSTVIPLPFLFFLFFFLWKDLFFIFYPFIFFSHTVFLCWLINSTNYIHTYTHTHTRARFNLSSPRPRGIHPATHHQKTSLGFIIPTILFHILSWVSLITTPYLVFCDFLRGANLERPARSLPSNP